MTAEDDFETRYLKEHQRPLHLDRYTWSPALWCTPTHLRYLVSAQRQDYCRLLVARRENEMRGAMCILAMTLALSPTQASAACDDTCAVIKHVLDSRSNDFADLKGAADPAMAEHWNATTALPGFTCTIGKVPSDSSNHLAPRYAFTCFPTAKEDQRKVFRRVISSFREAAAGWKWFSDESEGSVVIYGGPSAGKYLGEVSWVPLTGFVVLVVSIFAEPQNPTSQALRPYMPTTTLHLPVRPVS